MPPLSATPSAQPSSTTAKSKRQRWTREQLLKSLEILADLPPPLPPTLPPSPPASRSASPAPGLKRKSDTSSDPDNVKRPKTSSASDRQFQHHQQPQQPQQPHYQPSTVEAPSISNRKSLSTPLPNARSEPCEDGEVREEPSVAVSVSHGSTVDLPIRRPKKGKLTIRHYDTLHDKYHNAGRMLKYSGDARFWSTYPPTHREYRSLPDPPPPGSSYHKYGGLIARLELLDALVCFTYSIWNRDYGRRFCNRETWTTIEAFLLWCKQKWKDEEKGGSSDAEKAFLSLIWMIEGFIQGRKMLHSVRNSLEKDMEKVYTTTSQKIAAAAEEAIAAGDPILGLNASLMHGKPPPPMLPSPNSANSTPVNRDESTPDSGASRPAPPAATQAPPRPSQYTGIVPFKMVPEYLTNGPQPIPDHVMKAMADVTEPIGPTLVQGLKDLTSGFSATAWCMSPQNMLTLPIVRRCFPKTWTRMMYTTLLPTEEHEPDFEDEEGELYWPDQCVNGEGIGWVCLMGKAMINEFGKAYGYKGLDGVVPKPKPEELLEHAHGAPITSAHLQPPTSHRLGPSPAHIPSHSTQRPTVPR